MLRLGIPVDHQNGDMATPSRMAQPALPTLAALSSGWQGAPFLSPAWNLHVHRYGGLSTHPTHPPVLTLTVGKGDAGSIEDSLGQAVVIGFYSIGSCLQGIPDLLAAFKGRCRVPKLIALAAQLPVCHGVVTLPLGTLLLQGLIAACGGGYSVKGQGFPLGPEPPTSPYSHCTGITLSSEEQPPV